MRVNSPPLNWAKTLESIEAPAKGQGSGSTPAGFAEELKTSIETVDQLQHAADQAMQEGSVNGAENIHETMIQLEEADISLRFLLKVRNKALEGYQEIMRMQF
ncbi:MAG: flagellar hook-basal body complex protein FliE [Desulforhabdus sp.]|jgi:flagellar hook-basal body complex protein FliE|nr:flagellar hook-basal body complex protein FliE [Desulforhabdus sp.]